MLGAQLAARFVDDPLAAHDHHVLLHVVDFLDPLDDVLDVDRMLGNQHQVGLPVGRAQRDEARVPAHHFDDRDAAMAFGRGPHALDAAGRHEHGRGIAGRDVVDHLLQIDRGRGRGRIGSDSRALVVARFARPFVDFVQIVQPQVVVDRLGAQHGGQPVAQRLQAVERAVAADADQPFDAQPRASDRRSASIVCVSFGST